MKGHSDWEMGCLEGGLLLYAYLQPLGVDAPGMEAGASLGSSLPPGEGRSSCEALVFGSRGRARGDSASQHGLAASRAPFPAGHWVEGSDCLLDS